MFKKAIRWALFCTKAGDLALAAFERWAGLAVVDLADLEPVIVIGGEAGRG